MVGFFWRSAYLKLAMIRFEEGRAKRLQTVAGKLFAFGYALFPDSFCWL
jgi:hypothetical protein